ncbi:MAG: Rne/Rng family ribonuclease [Candidatus Sumerlaea chitinivorans]|nr:Rne/Rng family ribonuclease [Candidatus Sumerlaea chitinivorans]
MKRVLINVEDRELRVAILEDDQLTEFYIESLEDKTILNNIYKGRVEGVLPGLSAAFVNIGLERNAFLHFDDVRPDLRLQLWTEKQGEAAAAIEEAAPSEYQPTEEELAVVATTTATPSEVPTEVAVKEPQMETRKSRRRRRGRRGGKKRFAGTQQPQPSNHAASTSTGGASFPPAASAPEQATQPPIQQGAIPSAEVQQAEPPSNVAPSTSREQRRRQRKKNRRAQPNQQRQQHPHPPRSQWTPPRPGADVIPGTRAATNPYDVFTPFAKPKKQNNQKSRRKGERQKTSQSGTATSYIFTPTTLPPDVALDKDSQEDFFGPKKSDEGWTGSDPHSAAGHENAGGGSEANKRTRRSSGRRRVVKRRGPAEYAVRRKKSSEPEPTEGASAAKKRTSSKRTSSTKSRATESSTRGKTSKTQRKKAATQTQTSKADEAPKRSRSARKTKSEKSQAEPIAGEAPVAGTLGGLPTDTKEQVSPVAELAALELAQSEVEQPAPKRSTRSRKKVKQQAPASAPTRPEVPSSPAGEQKPPTEEVRETATTEEKPRRRSTRGTRQRRKAEAGVAETAPTAVPQEEVALSQPEAPPALEPRTHEVQAPEVGAAGKATAVPSATGQDETETLGEGPVVAETVTELLSPVAVRETPEAVADQLPTESVAPPEKKQTRTGRSRREQARRRRERARAKTQEAVAPPSETTGEIPEASQQERVLETQAPLQVSIPELLVEAPELEVAAASAVEQEAEEVAEVVPEWIAEERVSEAELAAPSASTAVVEPLQPAAVPPARVHPRRIPSVPEALHKGDEIMVQVIKEEIGLKGARISTYLSLPGRYLVLLPYAREEGGVSRRVESVEERKRLKRLLRQIREERGLKDIGFIVRTAGVDRGEAEIRKDVDFLLNEWRKVQEREATSRAPALLYDDSDILYRLCRDVFDESISEILIDSRTEAENLRAILTNMIPELVDRVKVYEGVENIFSHFQVDRMLEKARRRKVWLKSGGYIIIDEAEALTAIDVNTGKFVGKDDQEKMILKTNLEAARVIARELKLRDIGGLIVIDFIDMRDPRNRETLLNEFRAYLKKDHAKTAVSNISEFGLVEMTRKRVRQSLRKTLFTDCPYCQGAGIVLNEQQIWIKIKYDIVAKLAKYVPAPDLRVIVHPQVKSFIERNYREVVRRLEKKYSAQISICDDKTIHIENYRFEVLQHPNSRPVEELQSQAEETKPTTVVTLEEPETFENQAPPDSSAPSSEEEPSPSLA